MSQVRNHYISSAENALPRSLFTNVSKTNKLSQLPFSKESLPKNEGIFTHINIGESLSQVEEYKKGHHKWTEVASSSKSSDKSIRGLFFSHPRPSGLRVKLVAWNKSIVELCRQYIFSCRHRQVDICFRKISTFICYAEAALPDKALEIVDPALVSITEEVDSRRTIQDTTEQRVKCMVSMVGVGVACSNHFPRERMKITDAISSLRAAKENLYNALKSGLSLGLDDCSVQSNKGMHCSFFGKILCRSSTLPSCPEIDQLESFTMFCLEIRSSAKTIAPGMLRTNHLPTERQHNCLPPLTGMLRTNHLPTERQHNCLPVYHH